MRPHRFRFAHLVALVALLVQLLPPASPAAAAPAEAPPPADAMVASPPALPAAQSGGITRVDAQSGASTTADPTTLSVPGLTGVAAGDVLVALVAQRFNSPLTPPGGSSAWSEVARTTQNATSITLSTLVQVADGPLGSTTWSQAGSDPRGMVVLLAAYRGVDSTDPVVDVSSTTGGVSTTLTTGSLEVPVAGAMLLGLFLRRVGGSLSISTMSEVAEARTFISSSADVTAMLAEELLSASGSTGSRSATSNGSQYWVTQAVALRPAATDPNATPTATSTPSNTPTATETPAATNTPVPATDTPTATNTPVPATDTPTATNTPVPATDTPTATNTPTAPTQPAQITRVDAQSGASTTADPTTLSVPGLTGVAAGDLLVALVAQRFNSPLTPPGGSSAWSQVARTSHTQSGTNITLSTLVQVADGPVGSTTWSQAGSDPRGMVVLLAAYRGVDSADPVVDVSSTTGGASTTLTTGSLEVPMAGAMLLGLFLRRVGGSLSISTMSEVAEARTFISSSADVTAMLAEELLSASGSTGSRSATSNGSQYWVTQAVALRPAATDPNATPQPTSTATATHTPSPTRTATPTHTSTATAAPTLTATTASPIPHCGGPYEPNDAKATASLLTIGVAQAHTFCDADDEDWAAFDAEAGKQYYVLTRNLAPGVDTEIVVYRADTYIGGISNDDGVAGNPASFINFTPTETGRYYVVASDVQQYAGFDASYELLVKRPCNDLLEPNNSAAKANPLAVDETLTQVACLPGGQIDNDWMRVTLTQTGRYRFEARNIDPNIFSLGLGLYADDATAQLASAQSYGDDTAIEILLNPGTYYLNALPQPLVQADGISYDIGLHIVDIPNVTLTPTWAAERPDPQLTATSTAPTPTTTPTLAPEMRATEAAVAAGINAERVNLGLPPLALNPQLRDAARVHSQDMAKNDFLGHEGSDGSWPPSRVERAGYNFGGGVGENVAYAWPPYNAVTLWMNSQGHRANNLHPSYRQFGVGVAPDYFPEANSDGARYTAVFASGPNVSALINNDATLTPSRAVTVTLALSEGVEAIRLSDSPDFSAAQWEAISPTTSVVTDTVLGPIPFTAPITRSWQLPAGVGERAVYVQFRFELGTIYTTRDTITLAPPVVSDPNQPALPPAMRYDQSPELVGAATFDLSLETPGGLLRPTLRLYASSFLMDEGRAQQGGPLGAGATLSEYAIVRIPDATPADTSDDAYMLLWDGVLWPLVYANPARGGDGLYHRAREQAGEELFIERHTGAGHSIDGGSYWEIRNRAGMTWRLGFTADSTWRFAAGGAAHAWRWNLDRVSDLHGNYQAWSYTRFTGSLNGVPYDRGGQPDRITWNGHTTQPPDRQLRFVYEPRTPAEEPDYGGEERFYLTERLREIVVEINGTAVSRYQLGYELRDDGARRRLLLTGIEQRAPSGGTVISQFGLEYDSLGQSGAGFHLARVRQQGTLRVSYSYQPFTVNGAQRYRLHTTTWETGAAAQAGVVGVMRVAFASQQGGSATQTTSYGGAYTTPDGGFGHETVRTQDDAGNASEQHFYSEGDFSGYKYKDFCELGGGGGQFGRGNGGAALALDASQAGAICHKTLANLDAIGGYSGSTTIQLPSTFEDILRADGTVQQLQTNYTYNTTGQPIYIDQYGEQGDPDDDRYIERDYNDATFSDLVTEERIRDSRGRLIARTTYAYQPGTRLLIERGEWLLEESRVLTTTYEYNSRGLLWKQTNPEQETTEYLYDAAGNREWIIDPLGNSTHIVSDALGRPLTQTDPRGATTSYAYEPATGYLDYLTDAYGQVTDYAYDARGRKIRETNPLGHSTEYQYNELDQLVVMTNTLGLATSYTYDDRGQLETVTDPEGRTTRYLYDRANGWLLSTIDPHGTRTEQLYDGKGRVEETRVTSPAGAVLRRTRTEYDAFGQAVAATDPLEHTTTTQYDALGRLIRETDPLGQTTSYQYDSLGRMRVMTDTLGITTHYAYDDAGRQSAVTDGRGYTKQYVYDDAGRLTAEIRPPSASIPLTVTIGYGYDAAGNRTVVTDALGLPSFSQYDLLGRLRVVTDTLGYTTTYGYDVLGNQTVVTDTRGLATHYEYDAASRLITTTDALGQLTIYSYDDVGNRTVITDTRGLATHYAYDELNRLVALTDPLNQTTGYGYDRLGNQTVVTDTAGMTTTLHFDAAGNVTHQFDMLGRSTELRYDALGRLEEQIGPDGVVRKHEYDAAGRLTAVVENYREDLPADHQTNVRTEYRYDANGNLEQVIDPLGHITSHAYDSLNRRIRTSDPLSRTLELAYTPRGELDSTLDAKGQTVDYRYDDGGRLTDINYPAGTPDVSYAYDPASNVITVTDGLGATFYQYDALNRMRARTRETAVEGGSSLRHTLTYTYTATGEVDAVDYWGAGEVDYQIDALGRVEALAPWGVAATDYSYTPGGRVDLITRPSGVVSDYDYSDVHQIAAIQHLGPGGPPALLDRFGYTLNGYNNRSAASQVVGSTTLTTTYSYDPLQRLAQAAYPALPGGPGAETFTYTLDAAGNRLNDGTAAAPTAYDAADQVTGDLAYSYDDNGNLLSDGTTSYSYDAANRLVQTVVDGVTTSYAYDGWGTLIREVVSASGVLTTTDYLLDEQAELPRVVGELRSDGTQVQYAYGPEGVAAQRTLEGGTSQGVLYPLLDAQASVRHLTDASGVVVRSQSYDAWGELRQQSGSAWTRLGYTGEPMGLADGTVYLRARHYQPALGRFLQRDSFLGIPTRPQSLHKYLYAENNPATYTDPSGKVVPVLLALWMVAEVGLQIYDTYDTLNTVFDPCVPLWEKGFVATLYMGGLFLPGGGYGAGGKAVLRHGDKVVQHADEAFTFVNWADNAADGRRAAGSGDSVARQGDNAEEIRAVGQCFNSFSGDTLVSTTEGLRPIRDVTIGDLVWAYHEGLRSSGLYTVTALISHIDPSIIALTLGGERLETTAEHPFFVLGRGWVEVGGMLKVVQNGSPTSDT